MIPRLFAVFATILLAASAAQEAAAQLKAKPLKAGEVLSGQLTAMRSGPRKKRVITYQLTSEPRLLPPPALIMGAKMGGGGVDNLEPAFTRLAALKPYIGATVQTSAAAVPYFEND